MIEETAQANADKLLGYLYNAASKNYIGECVSQIAHACQCAHFAKELNHGIDVEIASLLHDIGHYCNDVSEPQMAGLGVINHEWIGARKALEMGLNLEVAILIGEHVNAKRYLAATKTGYYERLSPASKETLGFQGGKMSKAEQVAYQSHALFKKILQVRVNDEKGKVENLETVTPAHYREAIANQIRTNLKKQAIDFPKQIYFVRHAQANSQQPNAGLTEKGAKDAIDLIDLLDDIIGSPVDLILSSPFMRALKTIDPYAKAQNKLVIPDYRLREFHPCDFRNSNYANHERKSFYNSSYKLDKDSHTLFKVQQFVMSLINDVKASVLNNYIVVTHGRWLSALYKIIDKNISFNVIKNLSRPAILKLTIYQERLALEVLYSGGPCRTRTCDQRIMSPLL